MIQLFDEYRTLQPTEDEVAIALRRASPRRLRLSRRWLLAPVAIAAVVFMAAASIGLPGGGNARDARAAEILNGAAAYAARQPDLGDLRPGEYLYGKQRVTNQWDSMLVTLDVEEWWSTKAWRRVSEVVTWQWRTPADRQRWVDEGKPPIHPRGDTFIASNDHLWKGYPTNPDALYNVLADEAAPQPGVATAPPQQAEMFVRVKDILRDPSASSELRAAALQVAGRIAGAEVIGEATDQLGRRGVIVAFPSDYWGPRSDQFLFDPRTFQPLAERELRPDSPPAEREWNAFPERVVVGSITARP
jgi:hypothetical protein